MSIMVLITRLQFVSVAFRVIAREGTGTELSQPSTVEGLKQYVRSSVRRSPLAQGLNPSFIM